MGPAKTTLEQDDEAPERSDGQDSLVGGYAPGGDRPLAGYAALMGVYGVAVPWPWPISSSSPTAGRNNRRRTDVAVIGGRFARFAPARP